MTTRIYKYGTGDRVPEGSTFLSTVVQEVRVPQGLNGENVQRLVWHYFLVEVAE